MSGDDRTLDAALSALAGIGATPEDDDARWAKRVASRVSNFAPASRRDLDPLLDAPFPDGFQDREHEDFDHSPIAADDHDAAGAHAADVGDARGWEGSMSDSPEERPPNSLAALSGLTRSGPTSSGASSDSMDGAAKGDDSGLINLKAMTDPPPAAAEAVAAAPATASAAGADSGKIALNKPVAAVPTAKIAVASTASANAPPASSTAAAAASVPAKSAEKKKGGAVIWIGLAGVAAAAAAAFLFVGPMARKDEAPSAAQPQAASEKKQAADEKVAALQSGAPAATAATAPDPAADPGIQQTAPGTPKPMATIASGGKAGAAAPLATATASAAKPAASATVDPINKPAGGNLDDVLGIGKDQPAKKVEATDNLPDKPESMDVRSAINGKVSAASGCVKGLEGPSNVSVTFGPGGGVSGVVVSSGPAKGTGAESCIKNAFSSAKVPPSKKGASGSATLVP